MHSCIHKTAIKYLFCHHDDEVWNIFFLQRRNNDDDDDDDEQWMFVTCSFGFVPFFSNFQPYSIIVNERLGF